MLVQTGMTALCVSGQALIVHEEGAMETTDEIRAAAKILVRAGGLKGGKARAEALTPEERREIAREAASARRSKTKEGSTQDKIPRATHSEQPTAAYFRSHGSLKFGAVLNIVVRSRHERDPDHHQ
jgi:hypothetical protein